MSTFPLARRATAMSAAVSLIAAGLFAVGVATATHAAAILPGPPPISEPTANNVTADALPTAQIDGVVWSQAIVGNTVYAGGKFANARPAGAAAGTNQVPRADLLSYDLTTGVLNPSFAPVLNGQVKAVVASPDGSRIYIGGEFTSVDGINRYRVAAFSTATGALITSFAPAADYRVDSIVATANTVYLSGAFSRVGGVARSRLAAVSAATGALLTWNPSADYTVETMVMTPSGSKLIVGGAFQNINGSPAYGLGAIDPNTGALLPWAANAVVRNAGAHAAIDSLSTDGTAIYGAGWVFGPGGNLEGAFSADPESGNIKWIEDCHGDTYGVYASRGVAYTVSHSHLCNNVGSFPQTSPWTMHRALAWTTNAVGTIAHDTVGYPDWYGKPAPSQYNWYPDLTAGTFTGVGQAAWDLTGNGQYLIMGGEFLGVNFTGTQQGLVRFAVRPIAPAKQFPRVSGARFLPSVNPTSSQTAEVSWQANWDRDSQNLTYKVIRNNDAAAPVYTTSATSQFWNRPTLMFVDSGLSPGATYSYRVYATDPDGNTTPGNNVTITMPTMAHPVKVASPNQPPVAASTSSCTNQACSFDGSGSSDPDGSLTAYAWDFGDGITGTGVTTSHTYANGGTYTVTLTVTDNLNATNSTTRPVTITVSVPSAADAYGRTVSGAWGSADIGGAWSVGGVTAANFSVSPGTGQIQLPKAGSQPSAYLNSVSAADCDSQVDFALDRAQTGSSNLYLTLAARHTGTSQYRLRLTQVGTGGIQLSLTKVLNGAETVLVTNTISRLGFVPGQYLRMRLRVSGSISVALSGKVWIAGAAEPAGWQVTTTDATNPLGPGGPGLLVHLSSVSTNAPILASFRNLSVGPVAGP